MLELIASFVFTVGALVLVGGSIMTAIVTLGICVRTVIMMVVLYLFARGILGVFGEEIKRFLKRYNGK